MDDFDTFKASRQKLDPSTLKFTEREWKKAYAAYRSSRKRLAKSKDVKTSDTARRQKKSPTRSTVQSTSSSAKSSASRRAPQVARSRMSVLDMRQEVRQNSAYRDLRAVLDLFSWIAIGVVVLSGIIKLSYYTDASIGLGALLDAVVTIIGIVILRLMAHVVIDIPDIALYRSFMKQTNSRQATEGSD